MTARKLELMTVGREHPDWAIELVHFSLSGRDPVPDVKERFQLVFIPEGTGIAAVDGNRRKFCWMMPLYPDFKD